MTLDRRSTYQLAPEDHETIGTIGTPVTVGTGFVQIVMELLHRYSGLKQRIIAERDESLVSRDRGAIREKIETEPKIRNSLQDLTRLSTLTPPLAT